jgi:D-sedoheptulose 7-phosphate isomerase
MYSGEIMASFVARAALYQQLDADFAHSLEALGERLAGTLSAGGKLLTCGNGGSAAEAQHLAEELVGRFRQDRRPLAALALTSDGTALTCIANDFGYADVFARQVLALARPGDLVLALSTSGNSENLVRALQAAREVRATTAALLGGDGGRLRALCDLALVVPSTRSDLIQELHLTSVHLLCALVERQLGLAAPTTAL